MRRSGLVGLVIAGALATGVAATGVVAVFTDVARTGQGDGGENDDGITTASRAKEVDVRIAPFLRSDPVHPCGGNFVDDIPAAITRLTEVEAGHFGISLPYEGLCVRNAGERPITSLTLDTIGLTNVESGCTGSEPEVDPDGATCGTSGEAGPHVIFDVLRQTDCGNGGTAGASGEHHLSSVADMPLGTPFEPGDTLCYLIRLGYEPDTDLDAVRAQSDTVSWRWRVTGSE